MYNLSALLLLLCAHQAFAFRMPNAAKSILPKRKIAMETINWEGTQAVDAIPETLVREIDGNHSMRRKFEQLCRQQQVKHSFYFFILILFLSRFLCFLPIFSLISVKLLKKLMAKENSVLMPGFVKIMEAEESPASLLAVRSGKRLVSTCQSFMAICLKKL